MNKLSFCPDSPTLAHHWLIDKAGKGTCKYCNGSRKFLTHPNNPYGDYYAKGGMVATYLKRHKDDTIQRARFVVERTLAELED